MNIRTRIGILTATFAVIIVMVVLGTVYVFQNLSIDLELLKQSSNIRLELSTLKKRVIEYSDAVKNWAFTGQKNYIRISHQKLTEIDESMERLQKLIEHSELKGLTERIKDISSIGSIIISYKKPKGSLEVFYRVKELDDIEMDILLEIERIDAIAGENLKIVTNTTEVLLKKTASYTMAVVAFAIIAISLVLNQLLRSVQKPFTLLIKATEDLIAGKEDVKIPEGDDEFGILAERFYGVWHKLKASELDLRRRLKERELMFELSKIGATTLELNEALKMIQDILLRETSLKAVAIYIWNEQTNAFYLKATNSPELFYEKFSVQEHPYYEKLLRSYSICVKEDFHGEDIGLLKNKDYNWMAMAVLREVEPVAIILFLKEENATFTELEKNILTHLATTLDSLLKNAELFATTQAQLWQINLLYEFSKALTTVVELQPLLDKITQEVTGLIGAKGCIIRLKQDNKLPVKACYGLDSQEIEGLTLEMGQGIPGMVAATGKAMLVEDVETLPPEKRIPGLNAKTVVCVPIKVYQEVIGTLGLYDKLGPEGKVIPFTEDDLQVVEGFATITSLAIEKVRIFEEQKKKEQEALEAKKRLDLLFETVQTGIVTLDRNYTILSYNRFVKEAFRLDADVIGKSAIDVFHTTGICPHCVAKLTFENKDVNTITQSRGANYAELSAYPVFDDKGQVKEAVVLIRDITDRVLYQEEILSLYKEVAQTKDYLESLIDNSADAIVTTDLEGIVRSWNKGAEKIYGFTEEEVIGKFLPCIPDELIEIERYYMERIKKGETIKDIETLRKTKDGRLIEVSLTLSPIKDASGEVIGISGISRDISEKKRVEKELIRKNQELQRLFMISTAMRSTLELPRLLRMILTAVTMSDGLGFNRAILFLVDEERKVLKGEMGVGPANEEEAAKIWQTLSMEGKTLEQLMEEIETGPLRKDSFLDRLGASIEINLEEDGYAVHKAIREKKPVVIKDAKNDPLADPVIVQMLGSESYALVPLVSRNRVIGLLWVDNYFTSRQITDDDIRFLTGFAGHVASAIENARLFEQVRRAEIELENIFESISDMLYITDEDYTIKHINRAVIERIGKRKEEIVGNKCYVIFHGTDEPYEKCPHHLTVKTKTAQMKEVEDPQTGRIALSSTSPIFDHEGNFMGTVHIVRDITEFKELEKRLAQAERMAALGEVAAKVAHEIRNPLVSIGGFAKRLERKLDGKYKEYATIITREVDRLERILKEILSFVRYTRLKKKKLEARSLINDIISLYHEELKKKSIEMKTQFDDPVLVEVDPDRLKEALINIVQNAISVLKEGGQISIRTYRTGHRGVIEISDNGPGIEDKHIPFIFDPFFTTKAEGTGLGLAITNRIIQEHGGTIEARSKINEGTTFIIKLPLAEEDKGGES